MLEVDLDRLDRDGPVAVDEDVPPDAALWQDAGIELHGPVRVRLEAREAGSEVIVHGTLAGTVERECRRCLEEVEARVDESVSMVFRPGIDAFEAHRQEVYPLPEPARQLELGGPVREHFLLAVPQYVLCREACEGLCPQCGTNLNEETCDCDLTERDDRWAPLRELQSEEERTE